VEIVRAITTAESTIVAARTFVERCGKTPVLVKDQTGFVVNALLFPYLNNAVRLLDAGVASREDIDIAMKGGCNFPMGPLELLDLVGLDTSLAIIEALHADTNAASDVPAPLLRRMVADRRLGRKCGSGFYDYGK
jgi:3-hydroxybutyryl-CoA dehydrogenase